jgi:hypothetical protein
MGRIKSLNQTMPTTLRKVKRKRLLKISQIIILIKKDMSMGKFTLKMKIRMTMTELTNLQANI